MPQPPVASTTASPGKCADLHRLEVLRDAADAGAVVVEDGLEEVPELELAHHLLAGDGDAVLVGDVGRLPAAHLLVEGVEELLARGGAGEGGAVEERAAEAAEVEQALRRAVEGDAHAIEHVDDARRRVGHALDGRLVAEEVAAVGRLLEVHLGAVALALGVDGGVDAALRAHRVRALHRDERDQVDRDLGLAELDDRHQTAEAAADDDHPPHLAAFAADRALGCHVGNDAPTSRSETESQGRALNRGALGMSVQVRAPLRTGAPKPGSREPVAK